MADRKFSEAPAIDIADVVSSDGIFILDKSATSGAQSGPGGTVKLLDFGDIPGFGAQGNVVHYLSLTGVANTGSINQRIATAINNNGPFAGAAGKGFAFIVPRYIGAQDSLEVETLVVNLTTSDLSVGGGATTVTAEEVVVLGSFFARQRINSNLFNDLGDLGDTPTNDPVEDAFNVGDTGGTEAWVSAEIQYFTATLDDALKVYLFIGTGYTTWGGPDISDTEVGEATAADFFEIPINSTPFKTSYFEIQEIHPNDTDFLAKEGYVPTVVSQGGAPYGKLQLKKPLTLDDIEPYVSNGIRKGGITHITGLTYNVWVSSFIVNGIRYDINLSQLITLTNGDVDDPRIDVICVEVTDPTTPSIQFTIIEGTPAVSPVKPTVDFETQTEITFKIVQAGETVDPDAVKEVIYDENLGESSEWDNTFLLTDGDLAATGTPFQGTYYIEVVNGTNPLDPRVVFDNDALIDFDPEEECAFALRTGGYGTWDFYSWIRVKLINSSTGDYCFITLNRLNIVNYGFFHDVEDWQVVAIPNSHFIHPAPGFTQYDRIEFYFELLQYVDLDWINILGGNPVVEDPPATVETKPTDESNYGVAVIPLTNHECYIGSAETPTTANSFTLSTTKVLGGKAFVYIDTTGDSAFPTITGTRLLNGDYFEAGEIYQGEIFYDGTNANLTWKKVGTSLNPQEAEGSSFTLATKHNSNTVFVGDDLTINPNTITYQDNFEAFCISESATDTDIICTGATGWTYSLKGATPVASGTFTFTAKGTCAIIRNEDSNLIYIYGDAS